MPKLERIPTEIAPTISFTTKVSNVGVGDTVISPLSGKKMLVREIGPDIYDLLALKCLDLDGESVVLTLASNEDIEVLDA